MKTAVLLIIGSAVIGPIEGQQRLISPSEQTRINQCSIPERWAEDGCLRYETIEQTCARAMKEIGAEKWFHYARLPDHPYGLWTREKQETGNKPKTVWIMPSGQLITLPYNETPVRCIPAPSGLK